MVSGAVPLITVRETPRKLDHDVVVEAASTFS